MPTSPWKIRVRTKQGSEKDKPFDLFQLEEYKNISTSHYESVKQVSTFFKYYLLVLAAPAFVVTLIGTKEKGLTSFLEGDEPAILYDLVLIYLTLIAVVGFLIFLYIVNLRHDAMLYARTVNKVRRYFYEQSDLGIDDFEKYLYLPLTSTKPRDRVKSCGIEISHPRY